MDINQAKQEVRERIWDLLEREQAVREPGVYGHIPDFIGSEQAADLLATLPAWTSAQVIMANPDRAQLPVRTRALEDGKLVYVAVPKLADELPFYKLDPAELPGPPFEVATSKIAASFALKVNVDAMRPIGLILCGTVAVNRDGVRLGKGAGYSDIEFALAQEAGLLTPDTVIVATVHSLQVLDQPLPESTHDFRVDFIATPDEVIACAPSKRPPGLIWENLDKEKASAIPALAARDLRP